MEPLDLETSQAVILDHSEHPRRYAVPPRFSSSEVAYNPLCGDRYTIYVLVESGVIRDVGFEGHGCAVSKASISMMAERIAGLTGEEARALRKRLTNSLTSNPDPEPEVTGASPLDELQSLLVVRNAPTRIRCALLGWEALARMLGDDS